MARAPSDTLGDDEGCARLALSETVLAVSRCSAHRAAQHPKTGSGAYEENRDGE
jgi:hypothetical protein